MKNLVLTILLLVFVVSPVFAADKNKIKESTYDRVISTGTIRCGYATWPPALKKDPNTGTLSGWAYDYIEEIGRVLELKIEWAEEVSWGNYIEGLNNNRYDLMCTSDWAVGERLKVASVSIPVFYSSLYAYARIDDTRFDGDLQKINHENVKIAVIDGDSSYNVSRLNFPNASLHALGQTSDGVQLLLEVTTKKADVVIIDNDVAGDFIAHNPDTLRKVQNVDAVQSFPEVFVLKQEEYRLKSLLDGAILLINNTALPENIIKKYGINIHAPVKTYQK